MEPMTALVLAFQVLALFSIAGALLIYLICKVRDDADAVDSNDDHTNNHVEALTSQIRSVFVTSADTALGLQLCTFLATKGCRVFAGMKETQNSLTAKLLTGWLKTREFNDEPVRGSIIPIQFDVTREDVLREATINMGAHMATGERGIAAVINTSGSICRGRFETQDVLQWEHMMKTNILGALRVAKTFVGFLRPTRGRLIYLGAGSCDEGLVAFHASRVAVEKCVEELRKELQPYGVSVVALDTNGLSAESLYKAPMPQLVSDCEGAPTQYSANILTSISLQVIERALWDEPPQERYPLIVPNRKLNSMLPCRSSLRLLKLNDVGALKVQNV